MPSTALIEKCCLIACPVAGNPTQYLVEQAFAQAGLDWRFMTFEVEPARLGDAVRGLRALGFHGVKVGEPFQETVLELLDCLTERARMCGSVNCLSATGDQLIGDNTEGAALVNLVRQHTNLADTNGLVLGAGRLARAIAIGLAKAGARTIVVASRAGERGKRLVESLEQQTPAKAPHIPLGTAPIALDPDIAVLVNATSLSTSDPAAELPLDTASFGPKLVVADVAYNTAHTWLTRQAAERGCPTIDGLALYVEQTALALEAWTGQSPDRASMREAAEEFLGI